MARPLDEKDEMLLGRLGGMARQRKAQEAKQDKKRSVHLLGDYE